MLAKVSSLADRYFVLIVLTFAGAAYLFPSLFLWVGSSFAIPGLITVNGVIIGLGIIMLGMGMTLSMGDVRESLSHPGRILIGTILQFLLMPLIAFILVVLFRLPTILGVGIILVGCCPGGTASNVIAYLSRADVPLSVSITLTSTMLAPLLTPWLTWLYAQKLLGFYRGYTIDVPVMMLFKAIFVIVIPIVIGLVYKQWMWGDQPVPSVDRVFSLIAVLVIALIVGFVIGNSVRNQTLQLSYFLVLPVVFHNLLGLFAGFWSGYLLSFPRSAVRSLSIEVGMQNSGLAVALAGIITDSLVGNDVYSQEQLAILGVPAVLFSVWHNISGPILASYWGEEE